MDMVPFPVMGLVDRNATHASEIAALALSRVRKPPSISLSPYLSATSLPLLSALSKFLGMKPVIPRPS